MCVSHDKPVPLVRTFASVFGYFQASRVVNVCNLTDEAVRSIVEKALHSGAIALDMIASVAERQGAGMNHGPEAIRFSP
jgi:hypothetical protein